MSDDGYPTPTVLTQIKQWTGDPADALAFVKEHWWHPDWGWSESDEVNDEGAVEHVYHVSTGGWSGNESLIAAMQSNFVLWARMWQVTRRSGHYEFRLPATPLVTCPHCALTHRGSHRCTPGT